MIKSLALVLVLVAAACGGSSKPATTPANTEAQASSQLTLGEMKLIDVNDQNKALLIHADGTIEVEGKKPAKVTADGKLVALENGETVLLLQPDGSIKDVKNNKVLEVKLGPDGSVTMGDKTISFDASGELVGGNPDAGRVRVEGATDTGLRRTAMFVLVALTMPGEVSTDASTDTSSTPAAVPPTQP